MLLCKQLTVISKSTPGKAAAVPQFSQNGSGSLNVYLGKYIKCFHLRLLDNFLITLPITPLHQYIAA